MTRAATQRKIQGIKISSHSPSINHLLFADDSLFFSLANPKNGRAIKQILHQYEKVSGQAVNLNKSSITFGSRVKDHVKTQMRCLLGIHNEGGGGKYLGIPEQFGRKKAEILKYVTEKVKAKTQRWQNKFLSPAGKEVLIKFVASGTPVYPMNTFKLLKSFCDDINNILEKFWWGKDDGSKGMHWFAWDRMSQPKKEGGMGFRDIEKFNDALLGKQVWRILTKPNSLMARVLKGRYFPTSSILTARETKQSSYIWKSLLHGRDLITKGVRFVIGSGNMIDTWNDPWLPTTPPRPLAPLSDQTGNGKVSDFIRQDQKEWNEELVRNTMNHDDAEEILAIRLCSSSETDQLVWHYNKTGDLYRQIRILACYTYSE
ncbi:uncharacterized protein LOC117131994 [Brassica rapa]|uniref:uncharacterized protein LOC117131994 n=1 Tax=Brassica campestris TaxID=3711 RepID=UPI0006AA818A|nr:uncharacterized protein LOC117131994 [Brassica rapa]XP_048609052.1 uncharacterized protein LOC125584509 [Brassica napus]